MLDAREHQTKFYINNGFKVAGKPFHKYGDEKRYVMLEKKVDKLDLNPDYRDDTDGQN